MLLLPGDGGGLLSRCGGRALDWRHQLERDKVIWLSRQLTALAVAHVQLGTPTPGTLALWHSDTVTTETEKIIQNLTPRTSDLHLDNIKVTRLKRKSFSALKIQFRDSFIHRYKIRFKFHLIFLIKKSIISRNLHSGSTSVREVSYCLRKGCERNDNCVSIIPISNVYIYKYRCWVTADY